MTRELKINLLWLFIFAISLSYITHNNIHHVTRLFKQDIDIEELLETEKVRNVNKVIDLSLPITIDQQSTTFANAMLSDTLVLPYRDDCTPCLALVDLASQHPEIPFLVIDFGRREHHQQLANRYPKLRYIRSSSDAAQFHMDSLLAPILYRINNQGRITEKFVGFDADVFVDAFEDFNG